MVDLLKLLGAETHATMLVMNESDMDDQPDRITLQRQEDDDLLAAAAIRTGMVRAWRSLAQDVCVLLIINMVVATLLHGTHTRPAIMLLLYGPLAIGAFFWIRGISLQRRAEKHFDKLPVWEAHRINLVFERVSDKGETL